MTDKIMRLIAPRFEHARAMAKIASRYIGMISDIVKGIDPSALTAALHAVKVASADDAPVGVATPDLASTPDLAGPASAPALLARTYEHIAAVDQALDTLRAVFSNAAWAKLATYNKSSTYIVDIRKLREDALAAHERWRAADDDAVFVAARALMTTPPIAFVLENETTINKFTIWLFGWALSTATGAARVRIQTAIERCKDAILGSSAVPPLDILTRGRPGVSALGEPPASSVKVRNVTGSPMEFDMRGLIDAAYIEASGLKTAPLSGLTKQVLRRFDTVRRLDASALTEPVVSALTDPTNPPTVVETVDGVHWRALEGTPALSTRPTRYAEMQGIVPGCFDENAIHILNEYAALKPASTDVLRGRIVDRLMRGFEGRLGATATLESFHDAATDIDDITTVLLNTLSEYAGVASPEAICTYAAKTDTVIRSLRTEIGRALEALAPPARTYAETPPTELIAILLGAYRSVLVRAVDELQRARVWNSYDTTLKDLLH